MGFLKNEALCALFCKRSNNEYGLRYFKTKYTNQYTAQ